jgi:hypothetical protein
MACDRTFGSGFRAFLQRAVISSWQNQWANQYRRQHVSEGENIRAGVAFFL